LKVDIRVEIDRFADFGAFSFAFFRAELQLLILTGVLEVWEDKLVCHIVANRVETERAAKKLSIHFHIYPISNVFSLKRFFLIYIELVIY